MGIFIKYINMVYTVRNKGFNIFAAATNPRVHPSKKTKIALDVTKCVTLQVKQTRFTGMRLKHGYRNTSRSTKQFLMGDKLLEQVVILTLKHHFFRPMYYASPIENSFYLGRALADLTDRHYALFANNQHPMQLDIYDNYNHMLRLVHSEAHQQRQAEFKERLEEVVTERTQYLNHEEGESLNIDDMQDIHCQVKGEQREKHKFSL